MIDQRILVDLDAIVDTRLGTVAVMDPDAVGAIMRNGYWNRRSDDMQALSQGLIDNAAYAAAYAARDVITLRNSTVTQIPRLLGQMTQTLRAGKTTGIEIGKISLHINTAPYRLTPSQAKAYVGALARYLSLDVIIDTVYLPLEQQSPMELDAHYDAYILYDLDSWDLVHRQDLLAHPIPKFSLITSERMRVGHELGPEGHVSESGEAYDPFKTLALALMEWVIIEYHPLVAFSQRHLVCEPS